MNPCVVFDMNDGAGMGVAMPMQMDRGEVLLTGATGFIGQRLYPALRAQGWRVRCASRRPDRAALRWPARTWVELDVTRPETMTEALRGCDRAVYLVHSMAEGEGFEARERAAADAFAKAAEAASLRRVVYLGGVAPDGPPSPHLASRLETGERLRAGSVPAIELRAGMIIGAGSESWCMVRDLASRLPWMVLPRWLETRSQPVAVDDVVAALVHALSDPALVHGVFDIPGPETLTAREILLTIAALRGRCPRMIKVPVLTPKLSSYWLRFVTRADYTIAKELVLGLSHDLIAQGPIYWSRMPDFVLTPLDEAAQHALANEDVALSPIMRWLEDTLLKAAPEV